MDRKADICIIGAGPGGCAAALRLSRDLPSDRSVLLVDACSFPRDKVCGDALSGKVMRELERQAPSILEQVQKSALQTPSWGVDFIAPNGKHLRVPFSREKRNGVAPGSIMPRLEFDALLFNEVCSMKNISVLQGARVVRHERVEDGFKLHMSDGGQVHCSLVLAADGANSNFARKVAGHNMDHRHHCAGVRAYYSNVMDLDKEGFIELYFLDDLLPGYFWIFPLPGGGANVGLGIRSDALQKKKLNLKKELHRLVEEHPAFRDRFKESQLEGKVEGLGLPLGSKKRSLSGDHYMLIGDAGHLIDPFTGEGISHAMISGVKAAEMALNALENDTFSAPFLKSYDQAVWKRLGKELSISTRLQQLAQRPWLFNFVVNRASKNPALADTISCMFNDLDMREKLKRPKFYIDLLLNTG